eukprot:8202348-Lingulodinium_polyedra.AAC.1
MTSTLSCSTLAPTSCKLLVGVSPSALDPSSRMSLKLLGKSSSVAVLSESSHWLLVPSSRRSCSTSPALHVPLVTMPRGPQLSSRQPWSLPVPNPGFAAHWGPFASS